MSRIFGVGGRTSDIMIRPDLEVIILRETPQCRGSGDRARMISATVIAMRTQLSSLDCWEWIVLGLDEHWEFQF